MLTATVTEIGVRPQQKLTILGDRQSGKTHMVLLYEVAEAYLGNRVLHETSTYARASDDQSRAEMIAYHLGFRPSRVSRTNGLCSIRFPSGGYIHFRSRTGSWAALWAYDLAVSEEPTRQWPEPIASRVIRTVST